MQARWTVRREAHVIFARPDHFHRSVDRLRHQRRFDRIVVLQPTAKSSAHQRDVHLHLIGIESDRRRDRVAAILRNLRRRPQFALRASIMRRAISRLHRRVRHERKFVFGGDVPSVKLSPDRPPKYRLAPFFDAACFSDAMTAAVFRSLFGPSSHVTLSTRRPSIAPHTLSATTATARVADLAHVTHARNLLRLLVIEARNLSRRSWDSARAPRTSFRACGSRCRTPLRPSPWPANRRAPGVAQQSCSPCSA